MSFEFLNELKAITQRLVYGVTEFVWEAPLEFTLMDEKEITKYNIIYFPIGELFIQEFLKENITKFYD